ncbi:DCC1-like thiol-disulfide oxidoreductase family protein [Tardiphaga sp. vice278]|uniref:DCC1-like thiol-disulfide oxidoreductase family protein n=1 Tax=Tardiphaga sp. vice278 TaxID=2592815 RepID=UPI001164A752|nr:DUF393 domain-containing protein [Tardiphaga sp. vice278]
MVKTAVYFDGSCPLCRAEIGHYRREDDTGTLAFVDVSDTVVPLPSGLTRQCCGQAPLRCVHGSLACLSAYRGSASDQPTVKTTRLIHLGSPRAPKIFSNRSNGKAALIRSGLDIVQVAS